MWVPEEVLKILVGDVWECEKQLPCIARDAVVVSFLPEGRGKPKASLSAVRSVFHVIPPPTHVGLPTSFAVLPREVGCDISVPDKPSRNCIIYC